MIKTTQYLWKNGSWNGLKNIEENQPQFCIVFGSRLLIEEEGLQAISQLKSVFPKTEVVTVSTAGNILSTDISYETLTVSCFTFEKTDVVTKSFKINQDDHEELGEKIAKSFDTTNLVTALLYTTSNLNAGNLLQGINKVFNQKILVSGGIAGDDVRFEKTMVGIDNDIIEDNIVMIGFYSKSLKVSYGSEGGWNTFGPSRVVTKAENNIVYEVDNIPVLDIYKEYLGPKAKDLPGSGLLFPFAIVDEKTGEFIVRGVQDVSEKEKSITFYADVKVGQSFRLMRSNKNNLIEGSGHSAEKSLEDLSTPPQVAILVSCVARRLALDQIIEDEIEEVKEVLGAHTKICGFYSYSEFSPVKGAMSCSLHNQTMTITTLAEV